MLFGSDVKSTSEPNNKSYNVGGILGRCAGTYDSANNIDALPGNLTTGYFDVSIIDCDNYGDINFVAANSTTGNFGLTYNGNRLCTVGGIAGVIFGADPNNCRIKSCENHGTVSAGFTGKSESTVLGGIVGFAKGLTIDGCIVASDAIVRTNENGGVGAMGSFAGFTSGTVCISSCTASQAVDFVQTKEVSGTTQYRSYWGVAVGIVAAASTTVKDCTFSPDFTVRVWDAESESYVQDPNVVIGSSNFNDFLANAGGDGFLVKGTNDWAE